MGVVVLVLVVCVDMYLTFGVCLVKFSSMCVFLELITRRTEVITDLVWAIEALVDTPSQGKHPLKKKKKK